MPAAWATAPRSPPRSRRSASGGWTARSSASRARTPRSRPVRHWRTRPSPSCPRSSPRYAGWRPHERRLQDAQARRDGHHRHGDQVAGRRGRPGRLRRSPPRGVHRQDRLRDPQPVQRRPPGDHGPRGRDRRSRRRTGPHRPPRRSRPHPASRPRAVSRPGPASGPGNRYGNRERRRPRPALTYRPPAGRQARHRPQHHPGLLPRRPHSPRGHRSRHRTPLPTRDHRHPAPPAPTAAPPAPPATAIILGPRDQAEPLSRMRLVIGDRMIESLRIAPHVWTSVEVDMQAIEEVRRRHKERFRQQEGTSLTYLPFIARATCDALRAFPVVNASLDMTAKSRIVHHYVNLGIAVDLAEQGLVVPVIRDADGLNVRGLARAIRVVADKATSGSLTHDDLAGSTFTITNPGPAGDYASAPIINQPNSAILSTNVV